MFLFSFHNSQIYKILCCFTQRMYVRINYIYTQFRCIWLLFQWWGVTTRLKKCLLPVAIAPLVWGPAGQVVTLAECFNFATWHRPKNSGEKNCSGISLKCFVQFSNKRIVWIYEPWQEVRSMLTLKRSFFFFHPASFFSQPASCAIHSCIIRPL